MSKEVDVVDAQALQTLVDRSTDVLGTAVDAGDGAVSSQNTDLILTR